MLCFDGPLNTQSLYSEPYLIVISLSEQSLFFFKTLINFFWLLFFYFHTLYPDINCGVTLFRGIDGVNDAVDVDVSVSLLVVSVVSVVCFNNISVLISGGKFNCNDTHFDDWSDCNVDW